VNQERADVPLVRRTVDELRRSGGNVLGVVLSRARERHGSLLAPDDESVFIFEELGR